MKNARECHSLNEPFHNNSSGFNEEKEANEGNPPHLLPLKEGGEGKHFFSLSVVSTQS